MSLEGKKVKCVACGAYLFDEDDVVFCPECGAPHHRDCYNEIGHCAMEDKHGTQDQYDFQKNTEIITPDSSNGDNSVKIKCPMCGSIYSAEEQNCPSCGVPAPSRLGNTFFSFDYLGGVPGDMDLGEGVTADEAKQFVFSNSQKFIPKFAANSLGKKVSFNWIALLFPCSWFLSRKMYKIGAFIGALQVAFSMLLLPFYNVMDSTISEEAASSTDFNVVYNELIKNIDKIGMATIICAFIGVVLVFALHIVCGVLGDYFYYKHTIKTVSRLKLESEDLEEDFRKLGGFSFILFFVGLLLTEYLPGILYTFL